MKDDDKSKAQIEEALHKSEQQYRLISENASDFIYKMKIPEGIYEYASPSSLAVLGYSPQDLYQNPLYIQTIIHPDFRPYLQEQWQAILDGKEPKTFEYQVVDKEGNVRWLSQTNSYLKDETQRITHLIGIVRDVTDYKHTEEKLERQNRLFNTLLENLPVGVFMVESPTGKPLIANEQAKILLGRGILPDVTDVTLATVYEAYQYGADQPYPMHKMPIIRGMYGEKSHIDDMKVIRPDKTDVLLEIFGAPVYGKDNQVVMSLVSFVDITERKQAEIALQESTEKLSALFASMTEMVALHELVFDEQGAPVNYRITDCNRAYTQITGIHKETVVGRLATEVYGTPEAPYLQEYSRVAINGEPYYFETYFAPLDKHFSISVVSPAKNKFATVTADITAIKRVQQIIAAQNKELEQLVYIASHDLRSPLVNVDGYSRELEFELQELLDLLSAPNASPEALQRALNAKSLEIKEALSHIRSSARKMDALLKGLLKLSRNGRAALNIRPLDMTKLTADLLRTLDYQVKAAGAQIQIFPLPPCKGDETQLAQVFTNLIDNALKYRHPQRPALIAIRGSVENGRAIYCVEDNGIGIAKNHQEKIFELFHRLDPSKTEGEGLGLTIVRQALSRLDGEIRVESTPGEGSRFYISLPATGLPGIYPA